MYSEIYNFIAQNRELFRFLYSIIVAFICFIIVLKTDRLFRISSHQGIRYFRNAFFFYGLAFIFRYILGNPVYFNQMRLVFEFFMIMGGFCLFYSLLWKRFEHSKETRFQNFHFLYFSTYNCGFRLFMGRIYFYVSFTNYFVFLCKYNKL